MHSSILSRARERWRKIYSLEYEEGLKKYPLDKPYASFESICYGKHPLLHALAKKTCQHLQRKNLSIRFKVKPFKVPVIIVYRDKKYSTYHLLPPKKKLRKRKGSPRFHTLSPLCNMFHQFGYLLTIVQSRLHIGMFRNL